MVEIDAVITWVDGTDPEWLNLRNKYSEESKQLSGKYFRDWGTLKYVLRGIDRFMPWVHTVHLVTCGHIPDWLNVEATKLHIAVHEDFFRDKSCLPVFNSNAIEANLHLIHGLAEKFVYFNDDMLVLKATPDTRFFQDNKPLDFIGQSIPRKGKLYRLLRSNELYVDIVLNELEQINQYFSKKSLLQKRPELFYSKQYSCKSRVLNYVFNLLDKEYKWLNLYHHPQPYLKQTLVDAHKIFKDKLSETSRHRFRSRTDVCQYIYRDLQLVSGNFVPYTPNDTFCLNIKSYDTLKKNENLIRSSRFFCANDDSALLQQEFGSTRDLLVDILDSILPEKSSFEI